MVFESDLDTVFDDIFAVEVVLDGRTIKGIFTEPTEAVAINEGRVEAVAPTLQCKSTDLAGIATRTSMVTVDGSRYTVQRIQRTGMGVSVLYLKS